MTADASGIEVSMNEEEDASVNENGNEGIDPSFHLIALAEQSEPRKSRVFCWQCSEELATSDLCASKASRLSSWPSRKGATCDQIRHAAPAAEPRELSASCRGDAVHAHL